MSFALELVPPMPAMRISALEAFGAELATALGIQFAVGRASVNWNDLVHLALPRFGVHVYPAAMGEIGDAEGATDPTGHLDAPISILLRPDVYDQCDQSGRAANRAHGTLLHEVSHAALHVPLIRSWARSHGSASSQLLNRVGRHQLRPYHDPEWQAWTLAGCIIAPRQTLQQVAHHPPEQLAPSFGISADFLRSHMRRLRLIR